MTQPEHPPTEAPADPNAKAQIDAALVAAAQASLAEAQAIQAAHLAAGNGPTPEQGDVTAKATPTENDVEFALRVFGCNDRTFLNADGTLNRALMEASVNEYRTLYAQRLLHGGQ